MILPCQIAASCLAAAMCYHDIRRRLIPDAIPLGLLLTGAGNCLALGIWPGLAEAAGVFGAGFLLFRAGLLGGGDVKALAAAAFMLPGELIPLCLTTALAGGALAVLALLRWALGGPRPDDLPYGVAISAGMVLCVWL